MKNAVVTRAGYPALVSIGSRAKYRDLLHENFGFLYRVTNRQGKNIGSVAHYQMLTTSSLQLHQSHRVCTERERGITPYNLSASSSKDLQLNAIQNNKQSSHLFHGHCSVYFLCQKN